MRRKRRSRCHWCGNLLRTKFFTSPERGRFCNEECYAEDIEYDAKQNRQWEEKKKAHGITAEDFLRMLFGAAFDGARKTATPDAAIPEDLYKKMIFLCHPDKHNGHPWAEEVTRWLLRKSGRQKPTT